MIGTGLGNRRVAEGVGRPWPWWAGWMGRGLGWGWGWRWAALWLGLGWAAAAGAADRPNVLWLTCEDTGPHLGCYGDGDATTPNLDALAARGLRYRRAWSVAPVCAPARTAIISGMYPSTTGAEHMRSWVPMPEGTRMYPQLLRDAGYYCSNNSKEDYNLRNPGRVWDESSPRAHWNKRSAGQPFFAVFNYTETHESQLRTRPHVPVHDPARVTVPPYMPDLPEVRAGWAQYHDKVTVVDGRVGKALEELRAAGLAEDTIVFFYGDHGSGMPRNKRSACDSGLRVPLIVHFPARWRHLAPPEYREGGESARLVSFVDLAPTLLGLAGVVQPGWMPGRAFAGARVGPGPRYLHGLRGRMDERIDLVRSVTDGRFVYVRNYLPHRPHGQHNEYMFVTPATAAWKRAFDEGRLDPVQSAFWTPKAAEELYDLEADPFETVNLAGERGHRRDLERLRRAHRKHTREVGDVDLLPEAEMIRRAGDGAPGDLGQGRDGRRAVRRWLEAAEVASGRGGKAVERLERLATSPDSGVRYWAAMGFVIRGAEAVRAGAGTLARLRADENPSVRVAAAEAVASNGEGTERAAAVRELVAMSDPREGRYLVAVAALNALDNLPRAEVLVHREVLAGLPRKVEGVSNRMGDYVERLLRHLLAEPVPAP